MSILIKGLDIPTEYGRCIVIYSDGRVTTEFGSQAIAKAAPIHTHGRLIDADALKGTLDYYIREAGWDEKTNQVLGWVKDEFIDSEPTIVEAEGE